MDVIWSPWRFDYITKPPDEEAHTGSCVFCYIVNGPASDEEKFILKRAGFNFVVLNIYPYATGHLMVVPYEHVADLDKVDKQTTDEMMDLIKRCQTALTEVYSPDGLNVGLNIGKAAGAGVESHIHTHVLPRWFGDVNFITSIGETRTMPESLATTFEKLKGRI